MLRPSAMASRPTAISARTALAATPSVIDRDNAGGIDNTPSYNFCGLLESPWPSNAGQWMILRVHLGRTCSMVCRTRHVCPTSSARTAMVRRTIPRLTLTTRTIRLPRASSSARKSAGPATASRRATAVTSNGCSATMPTTSWRESAGLRRHLSGELCTLPLGQRFRGLEPIRVRSSPGRAGDLGQGYRRAADLRDLSQPA